MKNMIRPLFWENDTVVMIDQRVLPLKERYVACTGYREVIAAIKDLTVRGAPAIGIATAMGIALGTLRIEADTVEGFRNAFAEICGQFSAARPTARNLFWAIERMQRRFDDTVGEAAVSRIQAIGRPSKNAAEPSSGISYADPQTGEREREPFAGSAGEDPFRLVREALVAEAIRIGEEDVAINRRIGFNGNNLIPDGARILTHCNAGALATFGYGTALGVIRAAHAAGKRIHVFADETRPVLQGARLTVWELIREGIPCTLIADSMAGFLMQRGGIDLVIVGADRIAVNGDTANKIGTYALAILAKAHEIPFYVAAPLSTIDPLLKDGSAIPIEERNADEITHFGGVRTAPEGAVVWNPAFDVTPNGLITAMISETGVIRPPLAVGISRCMGRSGA